MNEPFVVIGGGIVGSAIAWHLQEAGAETVLVERDLEPQGASAFSFASITAFDEPLRDVYLLKSLGMVGWHRWEKQLGGDIGLRWDGEIRWAETPEAADSLRTNIDQAAGRGYPVRAISEKEVRDHLPESKPTNVLAASLAPEDGQADPRAAIDAARGDFADRGGTLLVGRASLRFDNDRIEVRVGDHQFVAARVILAAGAETTAFLERLGWEIPMEPSPGLLVLTEPTQPIANGTVYVSPVTGPPIHLRQLCDGRVLIGERAQDHVAKDPTMGHARRLLQQAEKSFPPLGKTTIDHFTVEWRPMPRDHMPIIGPLQGPSIYVATAHSGVTIAPAVGELVAHELLEHQPAKRLETFRSDRFVDRHTELVRDVEEVFELHPETYLG